MGLRVAEGSSFCPQARQEAVRQMVSTHLRARGLASPVIIFLGGFVVTAGAILLESIEEGDTQDARRARGIDRVDLGNESR